MDLVERIASLAHIAAGCLALALGPAAMLARKGGPAHRRWGKIYFGTMVVIFVTVLVLVAMRWEQRPNLFLLVIGVLSFYAALSGYRVLYRKRPDRGQRPTAWDWAAAAGTTAFGVGLIGVSLGAQTGGTQQIGLPPLVGVFFGALALYVAGPDLWRFVARPARERNAWWFDHMGGMVGSYIAATTAFLVNVAAPFAIRDLGLPESWYWLFWVGPPVAATVGLTLWQGAYRRKFRRGARPADVATVRIRTAGTEEPAPAAGAGTALAG